MLNLVVCKETARLLKVNMDVMKMNVIVAGTQLCPVVGCGI
jgi:hypothetical protein